MILGRLRPLPLARNLVSVPRLHSSPIAPSLATVPFQIRLLSMASATTFYDFTPKDKRGQDFPLGDLSGKVVLVVNTASKCGFTPQFEGLEKLYQKLKASHPDEFTIIGFPCNQFGGQDPGSDDQIQEFCQLNYGVTFPVLGKTDVNGDAAAPVWKWLKAQKKSLMMERIKWNFEKFLIGRDGRVIERWASTAKPETLEPTILAALAEKKDGAPATATEPVKANA